MGLAGGGCFNLTDDSLLNAEWHLSREGKKHSPISNTELLKLAELGKLRPDDLLWKRGFEEWKAASSIPGLLSPPAAPTLDSPSRSHLRRPRSSQSQTFKRLRK